MANHKSALKRARQNEIRRIRNKGYKTRAKNAVKEVRAALEANAVDEAGKGLVKAVASIHKAASKGVVHKNKAARKISRLARQINRISAS